MYNLNSSKIKKSFVRYLHAKINFAKVDFIGSLGLILLYGASHVFLLDTLNRRLNRLSLNYDVRLFGAINVFVFDQNSNSRDRTRLWIMNDKRAEINLIQIERNALDQATECIKKM